MNISEKQIYEIFKRMGMSFSFKGYEYLKKAILMVANDETYLYAITKRLYQEIAAEFDTTPSRVERAIRHAIVRAFDCADSKTLEDIFGRWDSRKSQPPNSQFIGSVVEYIKFNDVL